MSQKIVILNGSPRKNGNTSALIEAFTQGAESMGNQVIRFDLQQMAIHGCLGCGKGGKNPENPCVQQDDMSKIYPAYREADLIVLASPMYYWAVTGQLKCAFDRLYATVEAGETDSKNCILLMVAGDASESNFEPTRHYYTALLKELGWNNLGIVYAGGNMNPGDIQNKPEQLAQAKALGASVGGSL